MKRKTLLVLLSLEAAALLALVLLSSRYPLIFSSLFAFPFEQIAAGLRSLALSGRVGNALALALWFAVSAPPLFFACRYRGESGRAAENAALSLLFAVLLAALGVMANPGIFYRLFPEMDSAMLPVMKAILGGTVWSAAVLWMVTRLLRLFCAGGTATLLGYLRTLLYALCALFSGVGAVSCGGELSAALAGMQRSMDGVMAALRMAAAALPYALDIAVTLSALSLLDALLSSEQSGAVERAEKLSKLCCLSLGVTAASTAALNVVQLLLAQWLSAVSASVSIPLMSIAFVLAALLVARLIAENRRLRDESELFI